MRPQTAFVVSALGEEFRSAREARGLSLSDVAERLHIRSVYLAAIEDEDWHVIGAPVYVRGFMRTYARFLGLDPEAAVARFAAAVPAGTPAAAPGPARHARRCGREARPNGAAPRSRRCCRIVVAVIVVLFVGYEFYQYRAGAPAGPVAGVGRPGRGGCRRAAATTAARRERRLRDADGRAPPPLPTATPAAQARLEPAA